MSLIAECSTKDAKQLHNWLKIFVLFFYTEFAMFIPVGIGIKLTKEEKRKTTTTKGVSADVAVKKRILRHCHLAYRGLSSEVNVALKLAPVQLNAGVHLLCCAATPAAFRDAAQAPPAGSSR